MAFVAPDGSVVGMPSMAGLPSGGNIITGGGDSFNFANLGRDELNALIAYRNNVLAQQSAQAQAQNALAGRQLDVQGNQFDRQLFFNEQAQRASELQAYRELQAQQDIAERARQTTQMTSNFGAATQALTAAEQSALARQQLSASSYGQAAALEQAARGQAASAYGQAGALDQAARAQAAGAFGQAGALEGAGLDRSLGGYAQAAGASLGLQSLGLQGYTQAEQARVAQQQQALQTANLVAGLRGSSNAFKSLEVNLGLNAAGQSNLLGALAGTWRAPTFQGAQATPEAVSLATLARDAGATNYAAPGGAGGQGAPFTGFEDSASIRGMLDVAGRAATGESADVTAMRQAAARAGLPSVDAASLRALGAQQATGTTPDADALRALGAQQGTGTGADVTGLRGIGAQNASMVPGIDGRPLDQFAQLMAIARMNTEAGQQVLGPAYGPGSDFGARVMQDYQQALASTGETYMGADDPRLIAMYRTRSGNLISETQARQLTHYAEDYYRTYGQPVIGGMLNEMLGLVLAGKSPDLNNWSDVNKKLVPGYGTPGFKPPPTVWSPGQAPPPPGQPGGQPGQPPPGFLPTPVPAVPGQPATPYDPPTPGVPAQPFAPAPWNPPPGQVAPGSPPRLSPGSGLRPTGHQSATPKGWNSPEGYPAVTLGDGRAGYYVPATGQVIDGQGRVLDTAVNLQQSAGGATQQAQVMPTQYGAAAAPAPSAFTAPGMAAPPSAGPGGTTVLHPTTEGGPAVSAGVSNQTGQQAGSPGATYTFTSALPGGKGRGFLGTDGSLFDEGWNKVTW